MAHPHKAESDRNKDARLHRVAGTKADSGTVERKIKRAFTEHDSQLHGGAKTHLKFANGGAIPGRAAGGRLDKPSRGKKNGTTVNVVVAPSPGGGAVPAMPMPPPPMAGAAMGAPMPPVHPPMPMPPPGMAPAGLPPGMPMRKAGGGVYKAGAASGEGREEKIKNYCKKARQIAPENK